MRNLIAAGFVGATVPAAARDMEVTAHSMLEAVYAWQFSRVQNSANRRYQVA